MLGHGANKKMYFYPYIYDSEKKEEIWLSPMTKTPTTTEKFKKKKQRDNTNTPPKPFITQRLRTDLGRSVGVTTVTQLVWSKQSTNDPKVEKINVNFFFTWPVAFIGKYLPQFSYASLQANAMGVWTSMSDTSSCFSINGICFQLRDK